MIDKARFKKEHPYLDIAGGLFVFGVGRAVGLPPLLALAGGATTWYFLP